MGTRLASTLAVVAAVALLVGVPVGIALFHTLISDESLGAALGTVPLGLELATACAWSCLFLALRWLASKHVAPHSLPQGMVVFILAFTAGSLLLYRSDPAASRALYAAQYAVLVLLAFWLFDFLASWLPTPTQPQARRRAAQALAASDHTRAFARVRPLNHDSPGANHSVSGIPPFAPALPLLVIALRLRAVLRRFHHLGALSPESAASPQTLGVRIGPIFLRLQRQGVVKQAAGGGFYLDPVRYQAWLATRRTRLLVVAAVAALLVLIAWVASWL